MPNLSLDESFFNEEPYRSYKLRAQQAIREISLKVVQEDVKKGKSHTIGIDRREPLNDYQISISETLRTAEAMSTRIPDEDLDAFNRLKDLFAKLYREYNEKTTREYILDNIFQYAIDDEEAAKEKLEKTTGYFNKRKASKDLQFATDVKKFLTGRMDNAETDLSPSRLENRLELVGRILNSMLDGERTIVVPDEVRSTAELVDPNAERPQPIRLSDASWLDEYITKETGYSLFDWQRITSHNRRNMKPIGTVLLDVQEAMPGIADSFIKGNRTPQEVYFAIHNFDAAFNNASTKQEKKRNLAEWHIIYGEKIFDVSQMSDDEKCQIMEDLLKGKRIMVANKDNPPEVLRLTSKIPELQNAAYINSQYIEHNQAHDLGRERYYTLSEGMEGIGNPLVTDCAIPIKDDDIDIPNMGGTFGGLEVSEEIKASMEKADKTGGIYFEAGSKDGYYRVMPKYPEAGSYNGETFDLRRNVNLLTKGIADLFVTHDGGFDFQGALTKLNKIYDTAIANPNSDEIYDILGISEQDRNRIKPFVKSVEQTSPSRMLNLYKIWKNFAENCVTMQMALSDEKISPEHKSLLDSEMSNFSNALEELKDMVVIDVDREKRMFAVTECSGSAAFNKTLWDLAENADSKSDIFGIRIDLLEDDYRKKFKDLSTRLRFAHGEEKDALMEEFEQLKHNMSDKKINPEEHIAFYEEGNRLDELFETIRDKSPEEKFHIMESDKFISQKIRYYTKDKLQHELMTARKKLEEIEGDSVEAMAAKEKAQDDVKRAEEKVALCSTYKYSPFKTDAQNRLEAVKAQLQDLVDSVEKHTKLETQLEENSMQLQNLIDNTHSMDESGQLSRKISELTNKHILLEDQLRKSTQRLQQLVGEPDPMKGNTLNNKIAELSERYASLESYIKDNPQELQQLKDSIMESYTLLEDSYKEYKDMGYFDVERKWDVHYAFNPLVFEHNGEKYSLTFESFAPEVNAIINHPGANPMVSVGIFKDEAHFREYYAQDHENIENSIANRYKQFKTMYSADKAKELPTYYVAKEESKVTRLSLSDIVSSRETSSSSKSTQFAKDSSLTVKSSGKSK